MYTAIALLFYGVWSIAIRFLNQGQSVDNHQSNDSKFRHAILKVFFFTYYLFVIIFADTTTLLSMFHVPKIAWHPCMWLDFTPMRWRCMVPINKYSNNTHYDINIYWVRCAKPDRSASDRGNGLKIAKEMQVRRLQNVNLKLKNLIQK